MLIDELYDGAKSVYIAARAAGLYIWDGGIVEENSTFHNNTIKVTGVSGTHHAVNIRKNASGAGMDMKNNIFYMETSDSGSYPFYCAAAYGNYNLDKNAFYVNNTANTIYNCTGENNITEAPDFDTFPIPAINGNLHGAGDSTLGSPYNMALSSEGTNFSTFPPTVVTDNQDTYTPWEVGAYVIGQDVYYFDESGGNDSYNGLYPTYQGGSDGPWRTLGKLESSCANSPNNKCLLKCGETWQPDDFTGGVVVNQPNVTIGAYNSDGNEVDGANYLCSSAPDAGIWDNLPTIDVNYSTEIYWQDHVIKFDTDADGSAARFIRIQDHCGSGIGAISTGGVHDITVEGNDLDNLGAAGIFHDEGCDNWLITKNRLTDVAMKDFPPNNVSNCIGKGYTNPQAINASSDNVNFPSTITYNYINGTIQEGINCSAAVCMYNVVVNADNVGLYSANGPRSNYHTAVIAYNLVVETDNSDPWCYQDERGYPDGNYSPGCGSAIRLHQESASVPPAKNAYIYGNILIGTNNGFRIIATSEDRYNEVFFYNNTIIDTEENFWFSLAGTLDTIFQDIRIRNNASISYSGSSVHGRADLSPTSQWDVSNNFWHQDGSSTPTGWTNCNTSDGSGCTNGDVSGDPDLVKNTGWDTLPQSVVPSMSDMQLKGNSDLIGNGVDLGEDYDDAVNPNSTDFTTAPPTVVTSLQDDYDLWEIGAILFVSDYMVFIDADASGSGDICTALSNNCTAGRPCKKIDCVESLIESIASGHSIIVYMECGDKWTYNSGTWDSGDTVITTNAGATTTITSYEGGTLDSGCSGDLPTWDTQDQEFNGLDSSSRVIVLGGAGDRISYQRFEKLFATSAHIEAYGAQSGSRPTFSYNGVYQAGRSCLNAPREYPIIAYNDFSECVDKTGKWSPDTLERPCRWSCDGVSTPQSVNIQLDTTKGAWIHHNKVYNSYGEGIGASDGSIVEYNEVYNLTKPAIYIAVDENNMETVTVRHNLVWGNPDGVHCTNQGWCGGIRLNDEGTHNGASAEIYGNIVVNGFEGISLRVAENCIGGSNPYTVCPKAGSSTPCSGTCVPENWDSVKIYNNTLIDNRYNLQIYQANNDPSEGSVLFWDDVDIYNNASILYETSGRAHTSCVGSCSSWHSNIAADYNFFHDTASYDSNFNSVISQGDPILEKTNNWTTLPGTPSTSYFILGSDSDLIDVGTNLGSLYSTAMNLTGTDFTTTPPTVVTGSQNDYTPWEVGAFLYTGASQNLGGVFRLRVIK
jgi:hypothetical protein